MSKVLASNVGPYKNSRSWIGPKRLSTKARDTKEFELQGDINYRVAHLEVWMLVFFPTDAVSLLSSKDQSPLLIAFCTEAFPFISFVFCC